MHSTNAAVLHNTYNSMQCATCPVSQVFPVLDSDFTGTAVGGVSAGGGAISGDPLHRECLPHDSSDFHLYLWLPGTQLSQLCDARQLRNRQVQKCCHSMQCGRCLQRWHYLHDVPGCKATTKQSLPHLWTLHPQERPSLCLVRNHGSLITNCTMGSFSVAGNHYLRCDSVGTSVLDNIIALVYTYLVFCPVFCIIFSTSLERRNNWFCKFSIASGAFLP